MRIGFDIRPFLKQATGVGIYYKNLLFALAKIDANNRYYLFSSSLKDRFPRQSLPPFAFCEFCDRRYPVRLLNYLWQVLQWPPLDFFFGEELDLTHSPIPLILPTKGKTIVTVYDLFFMDFPLLSSREAGQRFRRRIEDSLQRADGVLTISRSVKDQVLERFVLDENKVRTVYLGVDVSFAEPPGEEALRSLRNKYGLPSSYLLFVGSLEPRKNLVRLLDALARVHQDYDRIPLVIAGKKGGDRGRIMEKIKSLDLQSYVLLLDFLSPEELKTLYHLARGLVFPSLNEGFGLPVVEAMASGLPCAVSKAPALPEIAGQAAVFFDPEDTEDMACSIVRLVKDEELRADLIRQGKRRALEFSWTRAAEETLRFYMDVVNGKDLN